MFVISGRWCAARARSDLVGGSLLRAICEAGRETFVLPGRNLTRQVSGASVFYIQRDRNKGGACRSDAVSLALQLPLQDGGEGSESQVNLVNLHRHRGADRFDNAVFRGCPRDGLPAGMAPASLFLPDCYFVFSAGTPDHG